MASVVMNSFKKQLMSGNQSLSGADTYYVALVTSAINVSSTDEIRDANSWADLSAFEVNGTGYTAYGQEITALAVTEDDTYNWGKWDGADVTWSAATLTAYGAVIYRQSDNALVAYIDFGSNKTALNGDFVISWNATGIMMLS